MDKMRRRGPFRALRLWPLLTALVVIGGRPAEVSSPSVRVITAVAGETWRIRIESSRDDAGAAIPGRGEADFHFGLAVRPDVGAAAAIPFRPDGPASVRGPRHGLVFPALRIGEIEVVREVGALDGSGICRWLDSFTNRADAPRTFDVILYHGGPGRPAAPMPDESETAGRDRLFVRRIDGGDYLGQVLQGVGGLAPVVRSSLADGGPVFEPGLGVVAAAWVYRLTLGPGERGILLNAAAKGTDPAEVRAELERHLDARLLVLNDLTAEERGAVRNFNPAPAGEWPQVAFLSPLNYGAVPSTFPVRVRAADAVRIVRMEMEACAESGGGYDDVDCRPPVAYLDQGASVDYDLTMSRCDFVPSRGEHFLTSTVWNAAGQSASAYVQFSILEPGGLSPILVYPPDGAGVSGRVNVHVDANAPNPADLTILVDGVERHRESRGSFADPPGVYWEWDTTRDSDGPHRLEAVLSDHLGNTERTCRATVSVFNGSPPDVVIERPADGARVQGAVEIAARAEDRDGPVVRLGLYVDGRLIHEAQGDSRALSAGTFWDTTESGNGAHEIRAAARDESGFEGEAVVHVEIRNVALSIAVAPGPPSGRGASIRLSIDDSARLNPAVYVLLRSDEGGAFKAVQGIPAWRILGPEIGLSDRTIQAGRRYVYRVDAFEAAGRRIGRSNEAAL